MRDWLRRELGRRPWWMNALMLHCAYMTFVYVPRDLLGPSATAEEVWFGVLFHGATAKLLEFPHWLVYGAGLYGFWRMRAWMWPWAALYTAQVAFSSAVWITLNRGGTEAAGGIGISAVIAFVALQLWRSRERFQLSADADARDPRAD